MSWLDAKSDVADYKVAVRVACPKCGKVEMADMPAETVNSLDRRNDGVYVDESECAECC